MWTPGLLQMFYHSVVTSIIFFAAVCWGGGIRSNGANKLNKLVRKASSVVGMKLDSVEVVTEWRIKRKLKVVMNNPLFMYPSLYCVLTYFGTFYPVLLCQFLSRGINKGTSYLILVIHY